jgi:5,6-dimethylbenzimidazole synthase
MTDAGPQATLHDPSLTSFYRLLRRRRDVRSQFTGEAVTGEVLERVLGAAHAAPSVGLSQPWDFVVVRNPTTRQRFREHVHAERQIFAARLSGERAERFHGLAIEGITTATLGIVVSYDPSRGAPDVLGRHAIADTGLYSVCLAIQNLWLAATAEGLGLGWVSFYREQFLRELVGLPPHVRPVAWLCVGPITHLEVVPDLERYRWGRRLPLQAVVHDERYRAGEADHGAAQ